jgi:AcrR family transcriptional regulator
MLLASEAMCEGPTRADLRRRRITDAARKLFVANGFHATGMAQLAKESGVAVGQIYRDFSSKEDIVAALVETDCGALMMYDQLEQAVAARDSAAVRLWLHDFFDPVDCRDDAILFSEIVAESARNERIASIFHKMHDQMRVHIRAALEVLAPGAAKAARRELMCEAVMAMSLGLFEYGFIAPDRPVEPVLAALREVLDRELAVLAS